MSDVVRTDVPLDPTAAALRGPPADLGVCGCCWGTCPVRCEECACSGILFPRTTDVAGTLYHSVTLTIQPTEYPGGPAVAYGSYPVPYLDVVHPYGDPDWGKGPPLTAVLIADPIAWLWGWRGVETWCYPRQDEGNNYQVPQGVPVAARGIRWSGSLPADFSGHYPGVPPGLSVYVYAMDRDFPGGPGTSGVGGSRQFRIDATYNHGGVGGGTYSVIYGQPPAIMTDHGPGNSCDPLAVEFAGFGRTDYPAPWDVFGTPTSSSVPGRAVVTA